MLKTNNVYTWNEIVMAYPDLWVVITDIKERDGEIVSCRFLEACTKQDKHILIKKYLNSGIKFECIRTTFKAPNAGSAGFGKGF